MAGHHTLDACLEPPVVDTLLQSSKSRSPQGSKHLIRPFNPPLVEEAHKVPNPETNPWKQIHQSLHRILTLNPKPVGAEKIGDALADQLEPRFHHPLPFPPLPSPPLGNPPHNPIISHLLCLRTTILHWRFLVDCIPLITPWSLMK